MSDVKLFQADDDGNISVTGGVIAIGGGLETAVYISLFGGNADDDGRDANLFTWWGNVGEVDPAKRYVSETQHLIESLPTTSGNLILIEDAAKRDLAWMVPNAVATVDVAASIPGRNLIKLVITINGTDNSVFTQNWRSEYGA